MSIPTVTILKNTPSSFGFTTFLSIMREGSESAVTPIMNESAVPIPTPFPTSASAIGSVPKISAYIGIPAKVATKTEYHLS